MKSRVFNFRLHIELYEYLKMISKKNFMTMSGYLIFLLKKDMEKNIKND